MAIRPENNRDEFIKATHLKKIHLDGEFLGIALTAREIEIITCLLKGMSSKETGDALFLSSRTVEDYHRELRSKFNAGSKSKLIKILLEADFTSYITNE